MTRTARCSCGALRAEASGEPAFVIACHCIECQRRTGAAFGVGAYFDRAHVRVDGPSTVFARPGQDGRYLRCHFCPTCGTTVHWDLDVFPDKVGIAVGAFADPAFPAPSRSVFERSKHAWVELPSGVARFETTSVRR